MQCAISGGVPKEPVVSKTGYIFEKSLIEKYISANKKCPITGEPLSEDDLIPLKGSAAPVKPSVPSATSIPGLIQLFQNEWEASALETYTLKQQLDAAKQELAHTLYRYDAACRVISRLSKERDEARQLLSLKRKRDDVTGDVKNDVANKNEGDENILAKKSKKVTVPEVMPDSLVKRVMDESAKLVAGRKGRKKPADLAGEESFKDYSQSMSIPLHNSSMPGIKNIDLSGTRLLTGGVDGTIILSDIKTANESKAVFSGHSKPITSLSFHPHKEGIFVSSAYDGIIKVWSTHNKTRPVFTSEKATSEKVTGPIYTAIHPALDVVLAGGAHSKEWSLWDIEGGLEVVRAQGPAGVTSVRFHPDGRIMATGGDDGIVRLWDSTNSELVKGIEGHKSKITDIAFSNNG